MRLDAIKTRNDESQILININKDFSHRNYLDFAKKRIKVWKLSFVQINTKGMAKIMRFRSSHFLRNAILQYFLVQYNCKINKLLLLSQ